MAVTRGEALSPEILRKIGKLKSPKKKEKGSRADEVVASPLGRVKLPNACPQISLAQISALPVRVLLSRAIVECCGVCRGESSVIVPYHDSPTLFTVTSPTVG